MKLVTVLMLLKYAGTIIAGVVAIIGAKKEAGDGIPAVLGVKSRPGWKKWALMLAVSSLLVALASQIAEQKINDEESAKLTETLNLQTRQLNSATNLLHELQAQAGSNQEINSGYLNEILSWLAQMKAQSGHHVTVISPTIRVFQQFTMTLTNSPNSEIREKAQRVLDQINKDQQYWNDSQTLESTVTTNPPSLPASSPDLRRVTPVPNQINRDQGNNGQPSEAAPTNMLSPPTNFRVIHPP